MLKALSFRVHFYKVFLKLALCLFQFWYWTKGGAVKNSSVSWKVRKVQPLSSGMGQPSPPLQRCQQAILPRSNSSPFKLPCFPNRTGYSREKCNPRYLEYTDFFKKKETQNDLKRVWVANRLLSLWLLYMPGLAGSEKVRDFILGTKQVSLSPSAKRLEWLYVLILFGSRH